MKIVSLCTCFLLMTPVAFPQSDAPTPILRPRIGFFKVEPAMSQIRVRWHGTPRAETCRALNRYWTDCQLIRWTGFTPLPTKLLLWSR